MINKNLTFCLLTKTSENIKIFNIYKNYISEIIKAYGQFTIINFCDYKKKKLQKKDLKIFKKKFGRNINFLYPKNKDDFLFHISNKKILAIDALGKTFSDFGIRHLINRDNMFLILLMNSGYISNEEKSLENTSFKNTKFIIIRKLNILIYRIFVLINIFPKTYFYFESRKKIFKNFRNGKIRKLSHKFPILKKLLNFMNIYKINSTAYDDYLNYSKNKKNNDKIIFIDSNFKHEDILVRENINVENIKYKYFKYLKSNFYYLEKIFNKKVEICLHPSSDQKLYKKFLRKFKINKGNTQKKILDSYMVIFHESSAIIDAILSDKKILILETNLLGSYIKKRTDLYKNILKIPSLNIENEKHLNKSDIFKKFNSTKKYRKLYIKNNLNSDGSVLASKKFIKVLNNFIINQK